LTSFRASCQHSNSSKRVIFIVMVYLVDGVFESLRQKLASYQASKPAS